MNTTFLFDFAAKAIYIALAALALFGMFQVILLIRKIAQKQFSSKSQLADFREQTLELLEEERDDELIELCDSPGIWAKALPQMILKALELKTERPKRKLGPLLAEAFERDVVADLINGASWIGTCVKSAPMLGLLGTVAGMIQAFGKIADRQQSGGDPSALAEEISFALLTTALGLTIAIPLVIASAIVTIKINKLTDHVQAELGPVVDSLDSRSRRRRSR